MAQKEITPWVRIAQSMPNHPKIAPLTDKAFRALIEMICYSAQYDLDGEVPVGLANRLWGEDVLTELASNDGDAPSVSERGGVYVIHGYADMQETREQRDRKRETMRELGRKGGLAKAKRTAKRDATEMSSVALSEKVAHAKPSLDDARSEREGASLAPHQRDGAHSEVIGDTTPTSENQNSTSDSVSVAERHETTYRTANRDAKRTATETPSVPLSVALSKNVAEEEEEKEKEIYTPYSPPRGDDSDSSDFIEFYDVYPRHVGKQAAARAFKKAAKKVSPSVIITAAERLAADPNLPEKQFIPHPATWLNQGRWEDEPLPERRGAATYGQRQEAAERAEYERLKALDAQDEADGTMWLPSGETA